MGTHPIFESDFDCLTDTSDDEDLYGGSGDSGSGDYEEGSGGSWDDAPETAEVNILDTTWLIIGAGALTAVIVICSIIYCCCIKKKDQDSYEFSSGQTREMA